MLFQDVPPRLNEWSDRMPAYSPEIEQTMQKYCSPFAGIFSVIVN